MFFVLIAYGENLKMPRRVVWNRLLACACTTRVDTQRYGVPRRAAFSLNLPYTVATSELATNLTVYVKYTRCNERHHFGILTAAQSGLHSQGAVLLL